MDAAEYKHVVLGLIILKYISDAFEEQHARLEAERAQGADLEDPDEYRAKNIFWVPKEARWSHLKANAPQPTMIPSLKEPPSPGWKSSATPSTRCRTSHPASWRPSDAEPWDRLDRSGESDTPDQRMRRRGRCPAKAG